MNTKYFVLNTKPVSTNILIVAVSPNSLTMVFRDLLSLQSVVYTAVSPMIWHAVVSQACKLWSEAVMIPPP